MKVTLGNKSFDIPYGEERWFIKTEFDYTKEKGECKRCHQRIWNIEGEVVVKGKIEGFDFEYYSEKSIEIWVDIIGEARRENVQLKDLYKSKRSAERALARRKKKGI